MKLFISMILGSAFVSSVVGVVTQDIFNSLALYTPLSLISLATTKELENRKIRKQLLEEN